MPTAIAEFNRLYNGRFMPNFLMSNISFHVFGLDRSRSLSLRVMPIILAAWNSSWLHLENFSLITHCLD